MNLPMRFARSLLALSLLAAPAAAAEWRQASEHELRLSSFDIEPATLRLKAGQPVRLRFVNTSEVGYSLRAAEFFRAAQLRQRDSGAVAGGTVSVGPGQTREIALVPAAGRYTMRSRNLFHRLMGMRGRIIVE
jgi:plastocyanin